MASVCKGRMSGLATSAALDAEYVADALSRFAPQHICVENVRLEGNAIHGVFRPPPNAHYKTLSPHLNTLDYVLCINQFAYLLAAVTVRWRLCDTVAGWTDHDLTRMRDASQLRICTLDLEMHEPVAPRTPIPVTMELRHSIRRGGTVFFDVEFALGAGVAGRLTAAMIGEAQDESTTD